MRGSSVKGCVAAIVFGAVALGAAACNGKEQATYKAIAAEANPILKELQPFDDALSHDIPKTDQLGPLFEAALKINEACKAAGPIADRLSKIKSPGGTEALEWEVVASAASLMAIAGNCRAPDNDAIFTCAGKCLGSWATLEERLYNLKAGPLGVEFVSLGPFTPTASGSGTKK